MLNTWVIEFSVRNDLDDADERGPRYNDDGRTGEAGS